MLVHLKTKIGSEYSKVIHLIQDRYGFQPEPGKFLCFRGFRFHDRFDDYFLHFDKDFINVKRIISETKWELLGIYTNADMLMDMLGRRIERSFGKPFGQIRGFNLVEATLFGVWDVISRYCCGRKFRDVLDIDRDSDNPMLRMAAEFKRKMRLYKVSKRKSDKARYLSRCISTTMYALFHIIRYGFSEYVYEDSWTDPFYSN